MSLHEKRPFEHAVMYGFALEREFGRLCLSKLCGSLRRKEQFVSDIDIVIVDSIDDYTVIESLKKHFPIVKLISGEDRFVRTEFLCFDDEYGPPISVDIWRVPVDNFGAATMYATGNHILNVIMRKYAMYKGMFLDVFGVHKEDVLIASKTEEDCYDALGWKYIEPINRSYEKFRYFANDYIEETRHVNFLDLVKRNEK